MSLCTFVKELPYDIQHKIYTIIMELRAPKKTLSECLKLDIETYVLYDQIYKYYKMLWCTYMDTIFVDGTNETAEHLMESEFLLTLCNFETGTAIGFDERIHIVFPNKTNHEIMHELWKERTSEEACAMTKRLWLAMSPKQRLKLMNRCYDEHIYISFIVHMDNENTAHLLTDPAQPTT